VAKKAIPSNAKKRRVREPNKGKCPRSNPYSSAIIRAGGHNPTSQDGLRGWGGENIEREKKGQKPGQRPEWPNNLATRFSEELY